MVDLDDNDSGGDVPCSICLDLVVDNGDRSTAKLQCGHQFHLDCIGSAFNVKGAMQCPNCRKVERGRWMYASGSTSSVRELSMDDWPYEEDPFELTYSEMPFGVHWCPFSGLVRLQSSFEEVESPPTAYHNIQRHPVVFTEPAPAASPPHSYVAYLGPVPAAAAATPNTNENVEDHNLNPPPHRWNGMSGQNEVYTPHSFPPAIDVQYHQNWAHHRSHPFPPVNGGGGGGHISGGTNSTEQAPVPSATIRSIRAEYDPATRSFRPYIQPFVYGHGRSHERVQASHAIHHPPQPRNPHRIPSHVLPGIRRFTGPRGLMPAIPASSHSDQSSGSGGGGYFIFPPPSMSGRNPHDPEFLAQSRLRLREMDHLTRVPAVPFERESGRGPLHHPGGGAHPEAVNRSGSIWPRQWS